MSLSLQELKELNALKKLTMELPPSETSKAIVRYTPKPQLLISEGCYKHGALRQKCASIGIQRTRSKRWRNSGDHHILSTGIASDTQLKLLEDAYEKASSLFHKEPCTCSVPT